MKGKLKENKQFSVLFADDDTDDTNTFLEAFGELNLDVDIHTVRNGRETLDYLDNSEPIPDILFLDMNMPVMGGRECLVNIRQNERYKDLCICMYSTATDENDVEELLVSGANVCIKKPHDFNVLKRILHKIITFNGHCQEPYLKRDFFMLNLGV